MQHILLFLLQRHNPDQKEEKLKEYLNMVSANKHDGERKCESTHFL